MNVETEIKELRGKLVEIRSRMKWLIAQKDKLADLPAPSYCGEHLDFDNLKHSEVVKVVRTLGGKWKKTPTGTAGKIHYEAEVCGKRVRCWSAEAPPSCKLIEVEEHVPEKIIPAHTVKKLVMKCHPDVGAVIATAAAKVEAPQADEVPL